MALRMKNERIIRKWPQQYVANAVGITGPAYTMIEQGKRKPSYTVLVKLEDLFGLGHRELFSTIDDDNTK